MSVGVVTATSFSGDGSDLTGLTASQIPNLAADKITSGTIDADRIPTLNQNTSGTSAGLSGSPSVELTNIVGAAASVTGIVTATTFVGALTGNVTGNVSGTSGSTTGNAATATKLATARTIAGVSFDGSANISLNNNAITNGAGYITTSFTNTNQLTNGAGFITASDDITGNTSGTAAGLSGTPNISVGSLSATTGAFSSDVTLTNTDTDSSAGPIINLFRNSSSPADADYLGQIKFQGESDTGVQRNYAKITGKISDASNGTEDGIIEFAHIKAGSQNISARFRSDSLQLLNSTNLSVNGTTTFEDDVTFTGASNNIVFDASDNALEFADDAKAKFGTGGDLEIYHDCSHSYISVSGTGALTIEASTLLIENAAGNQNMIQAHQSGAVNLYYANSKKFETTNTGVVVTGILTATSFSGDGSNLSNVGFTTSVGTFNASSGVATIDSFAYATEDYKVAEYTLHFTNGSDIQAQKLLVMQDGSTAYSQEFAVMSSASQLVSLDAIISGSNVLVRATPESGISGTTTFRWRRIVQE